MFLQWWIFGVILLIPIIAIIIVYIWLDIRLDKLEDESKRNFDYGLKRIHDLIAELSEQSEIIRCLKKDVKTLKDKNL